MDFKIQQNSVVLYGKNFFDDLPELNSILFDFEDLLRHALYSLDLCFRLKNEQESMSKFTKGVFKYAFLICLFFDESFKNTSIYDIALKIKKLEKQGKIGIFFCETTLACVKYRRGIQFSKDFSSLRKEFVIYCFFLLFEGRLWKKYDWKEIIQFCHDTYKGLDSLEDIAKRERNRYNSKKR